MNTRLLATASFCLATTITLSACGGGGGVQNSHDQAQIEELRIKVEHLERENVALKAKLQSAAAVNRMIDTFNTQTEQPAQTTPLSASSTTTTTTTTSDVSATVTPKTETANHPSFTDLDDVAQRPMIEELAKLGVFDGMGKDFEPYKKISRGEYVTWLYKAYNAIMPTDKQIHLAPNASHFFKDLKADNPAYKYAQALANAGFSVGYEDGTFKASQPITREELISMKIGVDCGKSFDPWRSQLETVWKFSDSKNIDERFTGYVHQDYYVSGTYGSNIQRAFGKVGTFHAKSPVTRCEAAGTLWQMGQFGDHGHTATAVLKEKSQS